MPKSLNVAIVASELPYPPSAGNRIRTLNLSLRLARRHKITFFAHRNDEAEVASRFLREHGIESVLVDRVVPAKAGPLFYARLAVNLVSPLPYSVASHSSPELRQAVVSFARDHPIDLWQAEATALVDLLADLHGAPGLIVAHNVESLIWKRYHDTEPNPVKKWYIKQQWRKFERFERRAFARAAGVIAVSKEDSHRIQDQFGGRRVKVVDNGIDRTYFEAVQPDPDPRQVLFLGSLDWRPNLDAVDLLLDRIFPAVRAEEPAARLLVVGRKPAESLLRRVAGTDGVELHANVPDVRPFLASSGVMVVPLRIGGGSRLKILEAMAAGLPVISTRVGAEGLELVPGRDYVAADDPETMVRELTACIRDPGPAREAAERCRAFVLQRYDWDALASKLEQVWMKCVSRDCATVEELSR